MSTIDLTKFVDAKFVDLSGLDRFWYNVKNYVDAADTALAARATALETTVNGTPNAEGVLENGLVQKVDALRSEVDALGANGGIQNMIDASIEALDLDNKFTTADTNAQGYAADAAAGALSDAKDYVDGIVNDTTAEDGSTVKGLNSKIADLDNKIDEAAKDASDALTNHVNAVYKNADDTDRSIHLSAGEREAWNKAKSDIDAFLSSTEVGDAVVDTLKELQDYIDKHGEVAADLITRVGKEANTETGDPATGLYKIIADNAEATAGALSGVDGRLDALEAHDVYVKKDVDDAIAAAAKAGTDAAAGVASTVAALDSKLYGDGTDENKGDLANLDAALKKYTDDAISAQAALDATALETALNSYYTKLEVDGLLAANSTADQAYAKSYVDGIVEDVKDENGEVTNKGLKSRITDLESAVNSIAFATKDDIDGIFTPKSDVTE